MKTTSSLLNAYTNLSNNTSAANQSTGLQLLDEQHRLLLEKYFDNEKQFTTETVGAMDLAVTAVINQASQSATLTGTWRYASGAQQVTFTNTAGTTYTITAVCADGATSATLSSSWSGPTGLLSITFDNDDVRDVYFTASSTAITWTEPLTAATTTTTITTASTSQIIEVIFERSSATITWLDSLNWAVTDLAITTGGFQKYAIPAGISKITNGTITVGQLRFVPAPVQTRTEWDNINFLPYSSDIPNYFYIYNGFIEFWPLPSTTGNKITFNYKTRVPNLSTAFVFSDTSGAAYVAGQTTYDYQKGTISAASVGSVMITGSSTSWNTTGKFPLGVDVTMFNLGLRIDPPYGDGLWYPIQSFTSDTALVLANPIMDAPNISSATYSIGQMPLLNEDFHDTMVYGALKVYFSTIYTDPNKFKQVNGEYQARLLALSDYAGTKQVNYNLGDRPALLNPNNYPFAPGNVQSQ